MSKQKELLEKLQARLPGLDGEQAFRWAAAAVKHLTQSLDENERQELTRHLPASLASAAEEGTRVVRLFGKERAGDFFVVVTREAGAPPSKEGARPTLANVLATVRSYVPERPAEEIERGLPSDIAELWRSEATV